VHVYLVTTKAKGRAGRPALTDGVRRDAVIHVMCRRREEVEFAQLAEDEAMSLSSWMRDAALMRQEALKQSKQARLRARRTRR